MSAVLLADVRAFLNVSNATPDEEIQATLARAEKILGERVGSLSLISVFDEVHTGPGPLILRRTPVASVTSVTSAGTVYTDVDVDTEAGIVYGAFSPLFRGTRVTYMAGRASLPADLEAAVLELALHLWRSQRGNGPSPLAAEQDGQSTAAGYLLPYRVQALIEPHLLPPVLA